ncbi:MAG: alpha/beta fold hydrolase [Gammaproteobacteria bacterium]|nr:alpha/beta fold hydrolase [Gammaproteobacteria bacterium]
MNKKPLGVLVLHGFSSNPDNYRHFIPLLETLEIEYRVPLLSGHGADTPWALSGVSWQSWIEDCNLSLIELSSKVDRVIILGHSMGGWLALNLSIDHQYLIDSVIIAGASLRTVSRFGPGRPLHFLVPAMYRIYKRWDFSAIYTDRNLSETDPSYDWLPIDAFAELFDLLKMTKARIHHVKVPTLILHSLMDSTNDPRGVDELVEAIATPFEEKRVVWFEKTEHSMFLDCERDQVNATILDHIKERTKINGNNH